jgi:hypothetical protein
MARGLWETREMERDPDDMSTRTSLHFSQSNPDGDGQGDVAALLRRVADTIDGLGDRQVEDLTFNSEVTGGEDDLTVTVYYQQEPRRRSAPVRQLWHTSVRSACESV